jgi:exopolysaccharide biosynthesis polyprenyl glycosylphosphotransferase
VTTTVRVGLSHTANSPTSLRRASFDWARSFASRLVIGDAIALTVAIGGSHIAWLGLGLTLVSASGALTGSVGYLAVSATIGAIWMIALQVFDSRGRRVIGSGAAEYKRVVDSTIVTLGVTLLLSFFLQLDVARGYVLTVFGTGLLFLIASRWSARQWLTKQRTHGKYVSRVVLIGSKDSVLQTANELSRHKEVGYVVVGASLTHGSNSGFVGESDIPVLGSITDVSSILDAVGADTVIATTSDALSPARMRELSWELEPGRKHLIVAPSVTDVGGARIHLRPVAGMPLIHVETPTYEGAKGFAKRAFDIIGSGLLLLLLAPVLITVSVLVKTSSTGPVFYRQERIGRDGIPFPMFKFRSMVTGADDLLAKLLEAQGTSDKPLFKIQNDPRVTSIGAILRRFSLDELPQLINVFRGEMSLVGPRPQRKGEVDLYDALASRRLLVTPGMSGLWQVSGRSNLSWEDSIRLDLYYVENWSITQDIAILWRTARAVFGSDGAY